MARKGTCQICRHEERWRIELLRAGGAGSQALADRFGVQRIALIRHWKNHVSDKAKASYLCGPAQLEQLGERAAAEGENVLDHLKMVRTVLMSQLATAGEANDARLAALISGRLTDVLEVIARVTGELGSLAQSVNITNNLTVLAESPAFIRMQAALMRALAQYPEARASVVAALRDLETESAPAPTQMRTIEHVK